MADERELILENIKTTLEDIKKVNGYALDVKLVTRRGQATETISSSKLPALLVFGGEEELKYLSGQEMEVVFHPHIKGVVSDEADDIDTEMNLLYDAVFEALHADETRGGYADMTLVSSMKPQRAMFDSFPARAFEVILDIVFTRTRE